MKKLQFLLALLLILATLLTSCAPPSGGEAEDGEENGEGTGDVGGENTENGTGNVEEEEGEEEELTPPVDETITILNGTETEYTVVYDIRDGKAYDLAKLISDYIENTFGVNISMKSVSKNTGVTEKEIIVGNVRDQVSFIEEKLEGEKDFAISVCGNDLVILANDSAIHPYLFRILQDKFFNTSKLQDGALSIAPEESLIYHSSEIATMNHAEYLKSKNGSITVQDLCEIMQPLTYTADNGARLVYRIYVPSDYDPSKSYPVFLMMHGAGERGNDNVSHIQNMVPQVFSQNNTPVTDAIVIAPQCPSNRKWVNATWADGTYDINTVAETNELAAVVELIGKINEKYSCDENRHYIMGLSMGAYATWDLLARHTDMFAAAVAICGGADTSTAEKIKDIPIWAAHGTADSVVPCSGSQNMVQALKDAGSTSIHYTEYEGKPHAIWNIVAADPEILNWLFSQVRGTKQS